MGSDSFEENREMKKLGFCLLALCLMGYVTGCGNEEAETPTTPPAAPEAGDTGTDEGTEAPAADPPA